MHLEEYQEFKKVLENQKIIVNCKKLRYSKSIGNFQEHQEFQTGSGISKSIGNFKEDRECQKHRDFQKHREF